MSAYMINVMLHYLCAGVVLYPDRGVGAADMSFWLGRSKPTVLKYFKELVALQLVVKKEIDWRPAIKSYRFYPTAHVMELYESGEFKTDAMSFRNAKLKRQKELFLEFSGGSE